MLDKHIENSNEDPVSYESQSLILRSDGTFVMYSESFSGGDPDISSIADGNWEMLSGSQVKVFGKWTDLDSGADYYEGTSKQNRTRIFKDVLTIDAESVTGTKMLGKFYLK